MVYEVLKALHIVAVISWMAGLLYMPRLFVYHADTPTGSPQSETFKVMERRLYRGIMNPAMIGVWIFGLALAWQGEWWHAGWWQMKFALAAGLTLVHHLYGRWRKEFEADRQRELHLPPAGMPPFAFPGEAEAEQPDADHCRIHDAAQQAALHDLESLALRHADRGIRVIDEQTGQVEQPGHPRNHRDDVQGFQDLVGHSAPRTRFARPAMNCGCVPTVGTRT